MNSHANLEVLSQFICSITSPVRMSFTAIALSD
jgi:hypothetical protein